MKRLVHGLSIVIMITMFVMIAREFYMRSAVQKEYESLESRVVRELGKPIEEQTTESVSEELPQWYLEKGIEIDFDTLQEENEDIVGWIQFDTIEISYPILIGEDNETYLRTDYQGKKAVAGSIFMDSMNQSDFSDYHTIIYGHNMRNGSMFGQLKQYKNPEFYEGNEFFTIYTPDRVLRGQIFSCHDTDACGEVYTVGFQPDEEYQEFVEYLKNASWYDCHVEVSNEDQIITLSTCTGSSSNRFVIHAKVIDQVLMESL